MDLDKKWTWVSRKLPRRVIPPGALTEEDAHSTVFEQLGIKKAQKDTRERYARGLRHDEIKNTSLTLPSPADSRSMPLHRRNVHKKFTLQPPKTPPRRVVLNKKMEQIQAALSSTVLSRKLDDKKHGMGEDSAARGFRNSGMAGDDDDDEDDENLSKKGAFLTALKGMDGVKKIRRPILKRKELTVAGLSERPGVDSNAPGNKEGSTPHYSVRLGKVVTTQAAAQNVSPTTVGNVTHASRGVDAAVTFGSREMKEIPGMSTGDHDRVCLAQLKEPLPISHESKYRLPDYFGEGDEKRLEYNLRHPHVFAVVSRVLEAESEERRASKRAEIKPF